MTYAIYGLPLLGALVGWIVSRVAVQQLFVTRYRQQLAQKLGRFAKTEFSSFNLGEKISDPSTLEKSMPLIEGHIDDFLRHKLKEQMPMIGMLIGDKTIDTLKGIFMKELQVLFPQVMTQFASNIQDKLDIEQLIVSRINNLSSQQLKEILKKELNTLTLAGAFTGLIIGVIQLIFTLLIK